MGSYYSLAQGGARNYSGALYGAASTTSDWPAVQTETTVRRWEYLYLDASLSSAVYGSSNTVQPPAISLIPQIRF